MYSTRLKTTQLGDPGSFRRDPILAAARIELTCEDLVEIEVATR